jgi:hypothetical protein
MGRLAMVVHGRRVAFIRSVIVLDAFSIESLVQFFPLSEKYLQKTINFQEKLDQETSRVREKIA